MAADYFDRILADQGLRFPTKDELNVEYNKLIERELVPDDSLIFGVNEQSGRYLHMKPEELAYGLHIPGRPGVGKSTAGQNIGMQIIDLIAHRPDESFIVIDPHGPVATHLLRHCIQKQIDPARVIYVDLTRAHGVVPILNPLRPEAFFPNDPDRGVPLAAYSLLEALTRAFGVEFAMEQPQTAESIFTTAAVIASNRLTFAETRFFVQNTAENWQVRNGMLQNVSDPTIIDHWREIENLPRRQQRDETASAARRFNYVLRSETLRLMLGQTAAGIDCARLLEEGTIAIFNLALHDTDVSDQGQRFLGAVLLNQINAAIRRRQKNAASPCYIFIDEFARFVSLDTMESLAELRGFGARLMVAHQRFDQLLLKDQDPRLLKAVLSIPNKLIFAMGLVEEQLELARQAYGPWVDLHKKKLELFTKVFKPYLKRIAVPAESEAEGSSDFDQETESEADQVGYGSGYGRGTGLITPLGSGLSGIEPTMTEHMQSIDSSFASSGHSRARGHGTGSHRMKGKSVAYPFVTDHEELDQLSHIEFEAFEEQILAEMQRAARQGVGDVTFMHGQREPPLSGHALPYQSIELSSRAEVDYLQQMIDAHPESFMGCVPAHRAIQVRREKLLAQSQPQIESSKGPLKHRAQSRRRATAPDLQTSADQAASLKEIPDDQSVPELLKHYQTLGLPYADALGRYLRKAAAMYEGEHWDESIFNHRRFLEGLLLGVAESLPARHRISLRTAPGARAVRDYLKQWGVIDEDARRMLAETYGTLSDPLHPKSPPATREQADLSFDLAKTLGKFVLQLYERMVTPASTLSTEEDDDEERPAIVESTYRLRVIRKDGGHVSRAGRDRSSSRRK